MTLKDFYMEDANREIEEALKKEAGEIFMRFYELLDSYGAATGKHIAKSCALEAVDLMEIEANKNLVGSEQFEYLREVIKGL